MERKGELEKLDSSFLILMFCLWQQNKNNYSPDDLKEMAEKTPSPYDEWARNELIIRERGLN